MNTSKQQKNNKRLGRKSGSKHEAAMKTILARKLLICGHSGKVLVWKWVEQWDNMRRKGMASNMDQNCII